jgi:hypothetical protein
LHESVIWKGIHATLKQDNKEDNNNRRTTPTVVVTSKKKTPFQAPATVSLDEEFIMGHGLQSFRCVIILDGVVEKVLEENFLNVVPKTSNRKVVLEMVEECDKEVLPTLMATSVHEVNSWARSTPYTPRPGGEG